MPSSSQAAESRTTERVAGVLLGFGLGGFIDGIVAHQILGWHHMLSGWVPDDTPDGLRVNMIGDGLFHLTCLLIVIVGSYLLHRSRPAGSSRQFTGLLVAGWGAFNVIEGLVDHHILGLHHVQPGPHQTAFDIGFLTFGALLLAVGGLLSRTYESR